MVGHMGGFPTICRDEIRDIIASLLTSGGSRISKREGRAKFGPAHILYISLPLAQNGNELEL